MGANRFTIVERNPNDQVGGGGCLCGDTKPEDQHGPFAVFHHVETDSNQSPHVVLCATCAAAVCEQAEVGDALAPTTD